MMLPDEQIRRILSGIYADACLNEQVDMREFVDNFESIREQILARHPSPACFGIFFIKQFLVVGKYI